MICISLYGLGNWPHGFGNLPSRLGKIWPSRLGNWPYGLGNWPIEIRLYILADIHGMGHFCTKLAPPPYNKPRSCVSKIHTPMVMVWFGNV
jgi:hypothetical protein